MLQKKFRESLTARIFFITLLILLGACGITFTLVAWATPMSYNSVINDELQQQTYALAEELSATSFAERGPLIDGFVRSAGAEVTLLDQAGNVVATSSKLIEQEPAEQGDTLISVTAEADTMTAGDHWDMQITADADRDLSLTNSVATAVTFQDSQEPYTLCATSFLQAENQVITAIKQMIPWLLLVLLLCSFFCAWLYSRAITRPILQLSDIAGKMADLDFSWSYEEHRQDEIGHLGESLNLMAQKLSSALAGLKASNAALRGEMEQEREMERQRLAFFSAAFHELKTPITILKGQLSGMLDQVGVYQDREKYLARSLRVTNRMENLIQEILTISRLEAQDTTFFQEATDLSELVKRQIELDTDLIEQRKLKVTVELAPHLIIKGNPRMLAKAIENLFSNALLYSPPGRQGSYMVR